MRNDEATGRKLALGLLLMTACGAPGDDDGLEGDPMAATDGADAGVDAGTDGVAPDGGDDGDGGGGTDTGTPPADLGGTDGDPPPDDPRWPGGEYLALCHEPVPAGAPTPPPIPTYSEGACPGLVSGINELASAGSTRRFILVAPTDIAPGERLPLVFLWHWLGGDADGFIEKGDVQTAADELRFVAIAPEAKGDLVFKWPFTAIDPVARVEQELTFFDDMFACAAATFEIETSCVSSVGVSAGALWTSQLASERGAYLSSFVSLSGGTGGLVKPWGGSDHVMPAFVLWGGSTDTCVAINFEQTSKDLEAGLQADGHPLVECIHNCSHAEPPFDQPEGVTPYLPMWQFFLDHPYWLADGETPWAAGLPDGLPDWCAMGPGSAQIREGACGPSAC